MALEGLGDLTDGERTGIHDLGGPRLPGREPAGSVAHAPVGRGGPVLHHQDPLPGHGVGAVQGVG